MSRVLLVFIFSLLALVGSINGQTGCGSTPTTNWRDQMEQTDQSIDKLGRIGYECQGYSGTGSGSGSGSASVSAGAVLLELLILIFIISGVSGCIWCICVQRQRAIHAANLDKAPGQVVGAHQVAHVTDSTKTVHKGDPNYQV